jgi:hypothetical protein
MRSKPVKFVLLVAAMLALSTSAIAACACTHHQSKAKAETPSCHRASHEAPSPEATEPVPTENWAGTHCECAMPEVAPAIVVTSKLKEMSPRNAEQATECVRVSLVESSDSVADPAITASVPKFHKRTFSRTGPSRAPPRL